MTSKEKSFLKHLSNYEKEYGKSFILEYPKTLDIEMDTEYLFIHTLIALEELHYFEIEKIWILDIFLHPDENVESYKVKINLKDKFFDEKNKIIYKNDFKNPAKKIENQKKELSFKDDKSTLSFDNKEIIISKTRNSNGHYLLKTIFKNKNKIWEYDEIAEDWTDEYKKSDWSRYYNAGYKVNEKVAKETTIKDFLVITNKTVCINKKYL